MKLIKFETSACPKCVIVSNFLKQQSVIFDVVDADEAQVLAAHYQIMSVPTTILVGDNETEVARSTGVNPKELMHLIHTFQKGEREKNV